MLRSKIRTGNRVIRVMEENNINWKKTIQILATFEAQLFQWKIWPH